MEWKCTKCGQCCKHVGIVPGFERMAMPDGSCMFLTPDNLCEIYDRRPKICNVATVYHELYEGRISEEEFYRMTQEACEKLQKGIV